LWELKFNDCVHKSLPLAHVVSQINPVQSSDPPSLRLVLLLYLGCTNPRNQVILVTKFFMVVSNICGPSVWNLLYVILVTRILRWLLDFWNICGLLCCETSVSFLAIRVFD
jgi:hypothetical protein